MQSVLFTGWRLYVYTISEVYSRNPGPAPCYTCCLHYSSQTDERQTIETKHQPTCLIHPCDPQTAHTEA